MSAVGDVSTEGQPGMAAAASAPPALSYLAPPPPYAAAAGVVVPFPPGASAPVPPAGDVKSVAVSGAGASAAGAKVSTTAAYEAFQLFCQRKEISAEDTRNLYDNLARVDVGVLVDDSPSMNQQIIPEGANAFTMSAAASATRWSEATKLLFLVLQIVTAVKPDDGVDLFFMNRQQPGAKVRTVQEAAPYFAVPPDPKGGTPMLRSLRHVFRTRGGSASSRSYLLVVVSDGEPTDGSPSSDSIPQLKQLLLDKPPNVHVSLAECTDNKESMDFLESWNAQVLLQKLFPIDSFFASDLFGVQIPRFDNTEGMCIDTP